MAKDIIERANEAVSTSQWRVSYSPVFIESFQRNQIVFADLGTKLERFIALKFHNPLTERYGKHDRPMTGALTGFWHCHLRDDAVLIYNLAERCINLVYIAPHAEIEGKRLQRTAMRLAPYNLYRGC